MTRTLLTSTIVVVAALALRSMSAGAEPPHRRPPDQAEIASEHSRAADEMINLPADYEALVNWAISLYDDAELDLPPLQVTHHGDAKRPCSGSTGWHHRQGDVSFIEICTRKGGRLAERLVLHEMAHAWTAFSLTNDAKLAFQDLRGWEYWLGHDDVSWHDLGGEQAAEIIAWGLSDRPIRPVIMGQKSCDDLAAGYRALTGQPPRIRGSLNGHDGPCFQL